MRLRLGLLDKVFVWNAPSLVLKMTANYIGRWILTEEGLEDGYLVLAENEVIDVRMGKAPQGSTKSLIVPSFVNAHTHLGDAFAYPSLKGSVEEIVGPPDGYKHRKLREASRDIKVHAMRESARLMSSTGSSVFADFREEGIDGVVMILEAMTGSLLKPIILSRPLNIDAGDVELREMLSQSDGFGMSSIRDIPYDLLERASRLARASGKIFALHCSETVRDDIDRVLDLKPGFLIHMTSAAESDLARCAEAGVPIVVCPRSNEFFGMDPRIPTLLRHGVEVALGTDNAMIAPPNMLLELQAAHRLSRRRGVISPEIAIRLATYSGRKVLNAESITTEISCNDDLAVIDVTGDEPLTEVATAAGSANVSAISLGGRLRRPQVG